MPLSSNETQKPSPIEVDPSLEKADNLGFFGKQKKLVASLLTVAGVTVVLGSAYAFDKLTGGARSAMERTEIELGTGVPKSPKAAQPPGFNRIFSQTKAQNHYMPVFIDISRSDITDPKRSSELVAERSWVEFGSCFDSSERMYPAKGLPVIVISDRTPEDNGRFRPLQNLKTSERIALDGLRQNYLDGGGDGEVVLFQDDRLHKEVFTPLGSNPASPVCGEADAQAFRPILKERITIAAG